MFNTTCVVPSTRTDLKFADKLIVRNASQYVTPDTSKSLRSYEPEVYIEIGGSSIVVYAQDLIMAAQSARYEGITEDENGHRIYPKGNMVPAERR